MLKFFIPVAFLFFSISAFSQLRLLCDVDYQYVFLNDKNYKRARVQLVVEEKVGQYWRLDSSGGAEVVKKKHFVFEVLDADINFKFAAIPNNGESILFDEKDEVVYRYKKKTIHKTGAVDWESIYLDRLTGKFLMTKEGYIRYPGKVSSSSRMEGVCVKAESGLKF